MKNQIHHPSFFFIFFFTKFQFSRGRKEETKKNLLLPGFTRFGRALRRAVFKESKRRGINCLFLPELSRAVRPAVFERKRRRTMKLTLTKSSRALQFSRRQKEESESPPGDQTPPFIFFLLYPSSSRALRLVVCEE